MVFVARTRTPQVKSTELTKVMRRQLVSLGILPQNGGQQREQIFFESTGRKKEPYVSQENQR